jgi:hypothetical protein
MRPRLTEKNEELKMQSIVGNSACKGSVLRYGEDDCLSKRHEQSVTALSFGR